MQRREFKLEAVKLPKDDGQRPTIAPNTFDREFSADRPNQRLISDFTYVWTADGSL